MRIVVTGYGAVTSLGLDAVSTWKGLIAGKSGISVLTPQDGIENIDDFSCRVAGIIRSCDGSSHLEDIMRAIAAEDRRKIGVKDLRRMGRFTAWAVMAAEEALERANWRPQGEAQERTGIVIGSGIGGLDIIEESAITLQNKGWNKVSALFIVRSLINLIGGTLSVRCQLKGPNMATVSACASGANAIGEAARIIKSGDADVMVAGGAEAAVCGLGMSGFGAMKALSTGFNDQPSAASRPWDEARDGFVMGEGAGIVVLESLEHALARGAKIYAELVGYGASGDAYHVSSPHESGEGAARCMSAALKKAGLGPAQIGYINAHGTSTPQGDEAEIKAIRRVFGQHASEIFIGSTKSSIGHLLGAAGGVEAVFTILSLVDNIVPPTLNLDQPMDAVRDLNLPKKATKVERLEYALSNSFGFGGANSSLIFKKFK